LEIGKPKQPIVIDGMVYEDRTNEVISNMIFDGSTIKHCGLSNISFTELGMNDSKFRYVGFDRAQFEEVGMHHASFTMVGITNAKFKYGTIEGSSFEGTYAGNTTFEGVNFSNAVFENCNIDGLVINGVRIKDLIESHPDYGKKAVVEPANKEEQSKHEVESEKMLGKTIQVRLVRDFEKAQAYYRDVLGCLVDGWGHAERDDMCFILQQAAVPDDVKPNEPSRKRATYPTEWAGPEWGWDSFIHIGWEELDAYVEEVRSKGGNIAIEPFTGAHGGWEFKNAYIQDLDGYMLVLGAMRRAES
jgi:catechol 2,3-dioxygenase-like lactoylglutathione lyase family enzyme